MIDTTVSHYRITSKLGGGGMGVVYKAEGATTERAISEYFMGDPAAAAKTWPTQALTLSHNEMVWPAVFLAFNGDIQQAQKTIDGMRSFCKALLSALPNA